MWKVKGKTKEPENLKKAYDYAVFLLSLQLRTEGEIISKMKVRGYAEKIIQNTIEQLKENRYLDDQRYAEVYLDNLKKYKTFGYYGIKKKLMEKRLSSSVIENALSEGLSEEEEVKIAKRFLKKLKLRSMSHKAGSAFGGSYEEKQKAAARLKSKGFRSTAIQHLLARPLL